MLEAASISEFLGAQVLDYSGDGGNFGAWLIRKGNLFLSVTQGDQNDPENNRIIYAEETLYPPFDRHRAVCVELIKYVGSDPAAKELEGNALLEWFRDQDYHGSDHWMWAETYLVNFDALHDLLRVLD